MKKCLLILSAILCFQNLSAQSKSFQGRYIKIAECYTCMGYYRFEFADDLGTAKIFLAKDKEIVSVLKADDLKAKNLKKKFKIEYRTTDHEDPFIGDCLFIKGTNELLSLNLIGSEITETIKYKAILMLKSVELNSDEQGFQYTFVHKEKEEEFVYSDKADQFTDYAEKYINTYFSCTLSIEIKANGLYYIRTLLSMVPTD